MRSPIEAMRALPLRIQLTILNSVAVLAALSLVLVATRTGVHLALFNEAGDVLLGEVRATALALNELCPDTDAVVAELRRKAESHVDRGWFVHLVRGDRETLWKSETCPRSVAERLVDVSRTEAVMTVGSYIWARTRITDPEETAFYIRIGMPRSVIDDRVRSATAPLVPIGLVVALCTPIAGYWLALRATSPLSHILEVADALSPTKLGDRLIVRGTGDELDRLSKKVNRLLDDVADHVERQQQFVADAAHEIRGPLTAIQSTLEVASSKERSESRYRDTIDEVLTESRHLTKLANDLLLLTEVGAGGPTPSGAPIDITPIVLQTLGMFAVVAEDRGIALVADTPDSCFVHIDPGQLRQVIANLIDNAIRFTPRDGSVRTVLQTEPGGARCTLAVIDNGIGIETSHLPHVFDRFFQADPARDRRDARRGGGLGLPICRSIVERHGGTIVLTSRIGVGTRATVTLPMETAAPRRLPTMDTRTAVSATS